MAAFLLALSTLPLSAAFLIELVLFVWANYKAAKVSYFILERRGINRPEFSGLGIIGLAIAAFKKPLKAKRKGSYGLNPQTERKEKETIFFRKNLTVTLIWAALVVAGNIIPQYVYEFFLKRGTNWATVTAVTISLAPVFAMARISLKIGEKWYNALILIIPMIGHVWAFKAIWKYINDGEGQELPSYKQ